MSQEIPQPRDQDSPPITPSTPAAGGPEAAKSGAGRHEAQVLQSLCEAGLALNNPDWADRVHALIDGIVDFIREQPSLQAAWRDPVLGPPMARKVRAHKAQLGGLLAVELRAAGIERSGANALAVAEVFLTIIQGGLELAFSGDVSGAADQQHILLEVRWAATEYLATHLGQ